MRTRLALPLLSALLLASPLLAQKRPPANNGNVNPSIPSSPGRTTPHEVRIDVLVTDEGSRPVTNTPLMVELATFGGSPQRTYTNMDGHATFTVTAGSSYQITVTGQEVETANSSFQLYPDESMHREYVAVKFKKDASKGAPGGVVSATNLNIPGKARDEFSKGVEEMNQSKWDSAKKHFEKAIKEYPSFDWAYNNLGVIELQLKNKDAAEQDFAKAVELNDKNSDATANLARMKLGDNDFNSAKELLKKSLVLQPQNPKTLTMLAFAQFKTSEFDAALATAEKVHQEDVDHYPFAHIIAGRVRELKGDQAGAERNYRAYLKESPEGPEAALAKEGLTRLEAKK